LLTLCLSSDVLFYIGMGTVVLKEYYLLTSRR
jgi:hypothetical protein